MIPESKKVCYCKKSFKFRDDMDFMFIAGTYYDFYIEDDFKFFWVYYDENGESGQQGCRFHIDSKDFRKIGNVHAFYEYFEAGRLMKLKKLNLLVQES